MNKTKIALAAAALLAAGCQTIWVDSGKVSEGTPGERIGAFYALPKGLVSLRVVKDIDKELPVAGKPYLLNADPPRLIPDPLHYYRVGAAFSAFSEDEITVTTTKEGLLTAVNTKSTDQSLAIVNKLIEFATEAAKAGAGMRMMTGVGTLNANVAVKTLAQEELDPTDCEAIARFAELAGSRIGRGGPIGITVKRPSFDAALASTGSLETVCSGKAGLAPKVPARCDRGVCFRPLVPYTITACMSGAQVPCPVADRGELTVLLPNDAPLVSVEIVRRPFVESTANYTFDNTTGIVTSSLVKKPSEVVGFLSIPIAVLKAIVSIPSAVLDFKVTRLSDQKEVIEAQTRLLEAQAKLLEATRN